MAGHRRPKDDVLSHAYVPGMTVERQCANQFVIPGRRASAGPGIQTQGTVPCFWIPGSRFQRAPE
jgi:hypothetical protein